MSVIRKNYLKLAQTQERELIKNGIIELSYKGFNFNVKLMEGRPVITNMYNVGVNALGKNGKITYLTQNFDITKEFLTIPTTTIKEALKNGIALFTRDSFIYSVSINSNTNVLSVECSFPFEDVLLCSDCTVISPSSEE